MKRITIIFSLWYFIYSIIYLPDSYSKMAIRPMELTYQFTITRPCALLAATWNFHYFNIFSLLVKFHSKCFKNGFLANPDFVYIVSEATWAKRSQRLADSSEASKKLKNKKIKKKFLVEIQIFSSKFDKFKSWKIMNN